MTNTLQKNDAISYAIVERNLSIEKAAKGDSLKKIAKQVGERDMLITLSGIIMRSIDSMNISRNMTEDQAVEAASILMDKFGHDTVEDIILMLRKAKRGELGENYQRIDIQVLCGWMSQHLEEKAAYLEKQHQNKKHSDKGDNLLSIVQSQADQKGMTILKALKKGVGMDENTPSKDQLIEKERNYNQFKQNRIKIKNYENNTQIPTKRRERTGFKISCWFKNSKSPRAKWRGLSMGFD